MAAATEGTRALSTILVWREVVEVDEPGATALLAGTVCTPPER